MTDQPPQNIYDEVPYPSFSFETSHPDRLATVATLLGMRPPPVEHCRVLEVGCASGGNLLPMAFSMPGSEFVGIDLSQHEVAEARASLRELGLKNVTLHALNILDVDSSLGQFDYIIAHGVYSWVPAPVRDKLLAICRQQLAPQGVAYISYNVYPGWHMLGALREMMLYHTRDIPDPRAGVTEGRALLDLLAVPEPVYYGGAHGSFLHAYVKGIKDDFLPTSDAGFLHDQMGQVNDPVYFHQFASHLAEHGLQYVADVDLSMMLASNLQPEVATALRRMAHTPLELEQYLDFVRNRTFRRSLVCHQEVRLNRAVDLGWLARLYVGSDATCEEPAPPAGALVVEKFQTREGAVLSTNHPVTRAALRYLSEVWPRCVRFEDLLQTARARLNGASADPPERPNPPRRGEGADATEDARALAANLLKGHGYSAELVELHAFVPGFVTEVSDHPAVSPVARWQAGRQESLTNLRHERVTVQGLTRSLLPYLDGSRDRAALLEIVQTLAAQADEAEPAGATEARSGPQTDPARLAAKLDEQLHELALAALLVS